MIVKCRSGLQSSKDLIGLEINVTILAARKRKDRHRLLNRPPAIPMYISKGKETRDGGRQQTDRETEAEGGREIERERGRGSPFFCLLGRRREATPRQSRANISTASRNLLTQEGSE